MAIPKQERKQELGDILEKAVDFHGHLGPFLVLGVRMGLIGIRELETKRGNPKLRVTMMTKPSVPFSCVIDGIQAATKCTIGNRKLRLRNSPKTVSAKFRILEGNIVTVTLNPAKQRELEKLLSKHVSFQEMEKIACNIISIPENELFKVKKK
ncbi:MAG: FmdE family protein [Candidatus Bathyarchaeia archaeon]